MTVERALGWVLKNGPLIFAALLGIALGSIAGWAIFELLIRGIFSDAALPGLIECADFSVTGITDFWWTGTGFTVTGIVDGDVSTISAGLGNCVVMW